MGLLAQRPSGESCEGLLYMHLTCPSLQAFRGFAGTSVLILVGVATDTARKVRAEQAMAKYGNVDQLYDNDTSY